MTTHRRKSDVRAADSNSTAASTPGDIKKAPAPGSWKEIINDIHWRHSIWLVFIHAATIYGAYTTPCRLPTFLFSLFYIFVCGYV